jgi:hypothetical protein
VIDSFIPWREISRAYFHVKETAAAPTPAVVVPPVTFQETPKVHEFETDDEEEDSEEETDDEDHPKISLGEETTLTDDEEDASSVNTEEELERRAQSSTVALNL